MPISATRNRVRKSWHLTGVQQLDLCMKFGNRIVIAISMSQSEYVSREVFVTSRRIAHG